MDESTRAELRLRYEQLEEVCREFDLGGYVPHMFSDPTRDPNMTPQEVDDRDREAVTSSVLVLAYVGRPSLGVGIEIEMAVHAAKPVVTLCEKRVVDARKLSRLVLGSPALVQEIIFDTWEDAFQQVRDFLKIFCAKMRAPDRPALLQP